MALPESMDSVLSFIRVDDPEHSPAAEEQALAILSKPDALPEQIEEIAKDRTLATNIKVRFALVQHSKTPRHIALNLIRKFYALELTDITLSVKAPPAIKHAGEEELIRRLEGISAGEKAALAHRATGPVASALLLDKENRVIALALDNGRLTEALVVKALHRPGVRAALIDMIARHPRWSRAQQIMIALMRHPATSLARIVEFAQRLPRPVLRDVMRTTRFNDNVRRYLEKILNAQR